MRFDLMNPAGYSGGVDNSFMSMPNPQPDFTRALSTFTPPAVVAPSLAPDPAGSLTGLGSFGSYGNMDLGYGLAGAGGGSSFGSGALDWLKSFPNSDWGKAILGSKNTDGSTTMGLGSLALGGASALGNLYMGMKQFGLMKDQLDLAKSSFAKNWDAQKTAINTQLADRQAARVASNSGAYESLDSYMKKNSIKG